VGAEGGHAADRPAAVNGDAKVARESFLDSLEPIEQARVLRTADRLGPGASDADWLVAYAAEKAAARIEKAARAGVAPKRRHASADLAAFGFALLAFAGIAWASGHWAALRSPSLIMYASAIGLGVLAAAAYVAFTARR